MTTANTNAYGTISISGVKDDTVQYFEDSWKIALNTVYERESLNDLKIVQLTTKMERHFQRMIEEPQHYWCSK